jgi:hypothetical protein
VKIMPAIVPIFYIYIYIYFIFLVIVKLVHGGNRGGFLEFLADF